MRTVPRAYPYLACVLLRDGYTRRRRFTTQRRAESVLRAMIEAGEYAYTGSNPHTVEVVGGFIDSPTFARVVWFPREESCCEAASLQDGAE